MNLDKVDKILVIGAGGTGSWLLGPLARYLYSQKFTGKLTIADGDDYTESNLSRQMFGLKFVGENKAAYHAKVLLTQIPELEDVIEYLDEYLGKKEIDALVQENVIVINCVDNFACRKYVEDRIQQLDNAIHICAGNELKNGQVQISVRKDGKNVTRPIFEAIPKFNSTNDDRATLSCEDIAKLPSGGQLISANFMAAALALNYLIIATNSDPIYLGGDYVPCDIVWFDCAQNQFTAENIQQVSFTKVKAYKNKDLTHAAI